jgi:hypothetical protein
MGPVVRRAGSEARTSQARRDHGSCRLSGRGGGRGTLTERDGGEDEKAAAEEGDQRKEPPAS